MMAIVSATNGFTARGLVRGLAADARIKQLLVLRHPAGAAVGPPVGLDAQIVPMEGRGPAERAAMLEGISDLVVLPNFDPQLVDQQIALVGAARARGVKRLHVVSLAGAEPRAPARCLRWIGLLEAEVRTSGLAYNVVRCAPFMQNLPLFLDRQGDGWALVGPFRRASFRWVDAEDVGAVLARMIAAGGPSSTTQATGPEEVDFDAVATLLGNQLGAPVSYTDVSSPEAEGRLEARGLGRERARAITEYWDYLVSGVVRSEACDTVERWLGRPPRALAAFLADYAGELHNAA